MVFTETITNIVGNTECKPSLACVMCINVYNYIQRGGAYDQKSN